MIQAVFWSKPDKEITYEGTFSSFAECRAKYGERVLGYSTQDQSEKALQDIRKLKARTKSDEGFDLGWESQRLNFLPTLLSGFGNGQLRILDVGGGYAQTFINLERALKGRTLEYSVIELPGVVKNSWEIFSDDSLVSFYTEDDWPSSTFDLVYFGSSLQYFEDYNGIIRRCALANPRYIVIADTTLGAAPTTVVAQVNMPNNVIPRWVFNSLEIEELLYELGFALKLRTNNFYPFHNFNNYEGLISKTQHSNFVFEKI